MKIFARNYLGFRDVELDISKVNLLVGDNSCGKSSLIYLIEAITAKDLNEVPRIGEHFSVDEFDYFSPYTDYQDVLFGFQNSTDSKFAKVVTVRRREGASPIVVKCTFFSGENFVTFRRNEGQVEKRRGRYKADGSTQLLAIHEADSGFKKLKLSRNVSISDPVVIIFTSSPKTNTVDHAIFGAALDNVANHARIVSPLRALPEKYYNFKRRLNAHGTHFASMWFDFNESKNSAEFEQIKVFGQESGLFDAISVRKIAEDVEDSPLVVTVTRSGKEFLLNQVGIGVSQVVPVLIDTMYSMRADNSPLLMQQPELHLHPIAQSALGTYLAKCSLRGLRPVIETHSSYLIDRLRAELRDFNALSHAPENQSSFHAEIIFCERTDEGNRATHIPIASDGSLNNEPDSYHQFFVEELVRTMF